MSKSKVEMPDQIGLLNSGPVEEVVDVIKPKVTDKPKGLVKQEYNGLFFAPELKKFVDPETDKPISDHTFEAASIMGIPANPLNYPTEDTVDWILEVVKGLPDFWYAKKIEAQWAFYSVSAKQWLVEVTKRSGSNLVFAPGLFAAMLIRHGEQSAINSLNAEFSKG